MKFPRRQFLHFATGAAALSVLPRVASALDYPTRPVHLIIGYTPGGSADMTARLTGQWLSERPPDWLSVRWRRRSRQQEGPSTSAPIKAATQVPPCPPFGDLLHRQFAVGGFL